MNQFMVNIINSILSNGTYINNTIHFLPTSLSTLHSFFLLRTLHSLGIIISSWGYLAITRLTQIT